MKPVRWRLWHVHDSTYRAENLPKGWIAEVVPGSKKGFYRVDVYGHGIIAHVNVAALQRAKASALILLEMGLAFCGDLQALEFFKKSNP